MRHPSLSVSLLLLLAAPAAPVRAAPPVVMQFSQLSIHQRIVIRVPRIPDQPAPTAAGDGEARWRERKAPKCIAVTSIAGASLTRSESIDLIIVDGRRLRAHFNNRCPAMDFYAGFYLKPTADGALCARRDSIRSRSGRDCRVESLRELVRRR